MNTVFPFSVLKNTNEIAPQLCLKSSTPSFSVPTDPDEGPLPRDQHGAGDGAHGQQQFLLLPSDPARGAGPAAGPPCVLPPPHL